MTDSHDNPIWTGVAALAIVLALIGVFYKPFLFVPLGGILLLIASKQTANQRLTLPGIVLITVCAVVGAAWAAVSSHALY